jgi:hypothetical protein
VKANRAGGAGTVLGVLLMLGASSAGMLVEPAGYWGDKWSPLPTFAAADGRLRLFYLGAVVVGSAIIGGLIGNISAHLTFELAQRGASPRSLRVGLAAIGTGVGALLSKPRTATTATVGAFVFSMILGAAIGVLLASRVTRSRDARRA